MLYVLLLVVIIAAILYYLWPTINASLGTTKLRTFTRAELSEYDGEHRREIYLGCKDCVFDVTKSQSYKPGATYHVFAGKDATIGLAKMSLDPVDLESSDTSRLNNNEMKCLDQWFKQFKEHYKYPIVGKLIKDGDKSS